MVLTLMLVELNLTFSSMRKIFLELKLHSFFYLALDIPPQRRNDAKEWRNRGQIHGLNKRENAKGMTKIGSAGGGVLLVVKFWTTSS